MKRYLALGAISFALISLTGCGKQVMNVPELLEPVDVKVDMAEAVIGDVSKIIMYSGEVVPYVESVGFASDGSLDQIQVMVGDTVQCGDVLAVLDTEQLLEQMEVLKEEIQHMEQLGAFSDRQLELDLEIANIELLNLQENWADEETCTAKEQEIQKLELQLKQAREMRTLEIQEKQSALNLLLEKEERTRITAPFDGTVIHISDVKNGDMIQAYEPVIYLADESQLSLATEYIPEYEMIKTERIYAKILDREYELSYLTYNEEEYVSMVLNDAEPKAKFMFEEPDEMLKSGQYAAIIVVKAHAEDVLTVPVNALYEDGPDWYVYRDEDGQRVRCDVTTGVISSSNAEIIDGLKEGDLVYVKD